MFKTLFIIWFTGACVSCALTMLTIGKEIKKAGAFGYKMLVLLTLFSWITILVIIEQAIYAWYLKLTGHNEESI